MELYVIGALTGLGYLLIKENKFKNTDPTDLKIPKNEEPSALNIYNSTQSKKVDNSIRKKQTKHIQKNKNIENNSDIVNSSLAGVEMSIEEFKHNNMVPYFGGSIKQNIDPNRTQSVLSRYTGVDDLQHSKQEIAPLGDLRSDIGNVYGMPSITNFEQTRMVNSKITNNILPFKQERIGPGLGQGYGSTPTGGFQQDIREFEVDRNIDELRIATNPKTTFEGRTVDGKKELKRGLEGEIVKNRVDTYFEQNGDMYFTTVGAYTKDKGRPMQIVKDTARKDTSVEYEGIAYENIGEAGRADVQESLRQQLEGFEVGGADVSYTGKSNDDYGKANILVYTNERNLTTTKTYEGNLTTFVKSIIAPLQDTLKFSNKEYTVQAKRPYGNLQKQFPDKLTVKDPNDIAKTTLKEQLIHDSVPANMTAEYNKVSTYDPADIAKITTRNTVADDDYHLNLSSKVKKQTIDPTDPTKTTIKELTEDKTKTGFIYRTTLTDGKGYVTNIHDARNTNRQLTSQVEYKGGIKTNLGGNDGYKNEDYDMKNTNIQFLTDEYTGTALSKDKKTMSYDDKYAMLINDVKELVLEERYPTGQGSKIPVSGADINLQPNKLQQSIENNNQYGNMNKVYNQTETQSLYGNNNEFTQYKQVYDNYDNERLDPSLLDAYKSNPYTQSLNSI
jgi:hypothetical protein